MAFLCLLLVSDFLFAELRQRPYRSAYLLGKGDAGLASVEEEDAIFYNPAGLALGEGIYKKTVFASPHIEFSQSTRDLYKQLEEEKKSESESLRNLIGKNQHASVQNLSALVFRRAALGVLFSTEADVLVSRPAESRGIETVDTKYTGNQMLVFSLAEAYLDKKIAIGMTGKYLIRNEGNLHASIIDASSLKSASSGKTAQLGTGMGLDFGLLLTTGKPSRFGSSHSLGLTVENLGTTKIISASDGAALSPMKQAINVGYALKLKTLFSYFILTADYRDLSSSYEKNTYKKMHFGGELNVAERFGATAGLNQGSLCAGLYTDFWLMRIDAGFYGEEVGEKVGLYGDKRYFLRVAVQL